MDVKAKIEELKQVFSGTQEGMKKLAEMQQQAIEMSAKVPVEYQGLIRSCTATIQKCADTRDIVGALNAIEKTMKRVENLNKDGV